MASEATFKDLKTCISLALVDTTRTAGQISNEDLAFQRSSNPSIVPLLERQSSRLLDLAQKLTGYAASGTEVAGPDVTNADSVEENWREIVDVVDNLLEKADACLDEFSGVIRKSSLAQEEQTKNVAASSQKQKAGKAHGTQNIEKPQLLFNKVPANHETTPFKPLLHTKPNAIVPLDQSLRLVIDRVGFQQYVQ